MSIDELPNKSVRYWPNPKARAKNIRRLTQRNEGSLGYILGEVKRLHREAQLWYDLSSPEKILLEERWTDTLLRLLSIGNNEVMHSIRYRLPRNMKKENAMLKTLLQTAALSRPIFTKNRYPWIRNFTEKENEQH